ncbi:DDE-type integrase/transposase/recombinase [Ruegeria sp.]|uniref:DDE-type integrase/transposase/recombinase n=1 Tax=Ruegeria sp. TaxID=1879320 RepID=UPI003B5A3411
MAPEAARATARARLAAVRAAEQLIAGGLPVAEADRLAALEADVSPVSLAKWRRRVSGCPRGHRVHLLLERPRTGRPGRLTPAHEAELEALAWHHGAHLTAPHALRVLQARCGYEGGVGSVRRWLRRWRACNERGLSAALAPDRHRSHRGPAFGTRSAQVEALNAVWEIDSTIADVICADGRRHALIAVIDIWSRRALFLLARTSRATAIAALLRRAILAWGVPEALVTDEGRDYTSRHMLGLLADLEIDHRPCRPYHPEDKPHVERLIGTVSRDLFAFLPGFAGHNVAQAQALRDRKSFAARRGESPAVTLRADLSAQEVQVRLDDWADAVYGRRVHDALAGQSPFERALSWTGPVRRVESARALDVLLAPPAGGGSREVGKKGISLGGRRYIGPELGPLVQSTVSVRHDPEDACGLLVFGTDGGFIGRARDVSAPDLDQAAIAAEAKAKAAKADAVARARARATAKRHHPETAMDDVLDHARREAAKVTALPRDQAPYATPALAQAAKAADRASNRPSDTPGRQAVPFNRALAAAAKLYLDEDH